jgi:hypothetical protein
LVQCSKDKFNKGHEWYVRRVKMRSNQAQAFTIKRTCLLLPHVPKQGYFSTSTPRQKAT